MDPAGSLGTLLHLGRGKLAVAEAQLEEPGEKVMWPRLYSAWPPICADSIMMCAPPDSLHVRHQQVALTHLILHAFQHDFLMHMAFIYIL